MKVKELIASLQKLNQDLEVYLTAEQIPEVKSSEVIAFSPDNISELAVNLYKSESGVLCVEPMENSHAHKIVAIHILPQ
jgi:hypothetical protein